MPTILIIDDEPDVNKVLSNLLESEDYIVYTAGDGKTALDIVRNKKPELVLLDIRLPDIDGIQLLSEIKKINANIPVIMCSAFDDKDRIADAMKKGASTYITKPFKNVDVLYAVRKVLPAGKKKIKLRTITYTGIIFVSLIVLIVIIVKITKVEKNFFAIPSLNLVGLTSDGTNLWVNDWYNEIIYKCRFKKNKFSVVKIYPINIHIAGLSSGDNCLWSCDNWSKKIYKHSLDNNLPIISEYNSPGNNPVCVLWDGNYLWSIDSNTNKIYKHITGKTIAVQKSFTSQSSTIIGLFWYQDSLWSVDAEKSLIYKHDATNPENIISTYPVKVPGYEKNKISGVACDGKNIWLSLEKTPKLYRQNIKTFIKK